MASLATSQFMFHDDTIDVLVGNRVVNNVQLTNSRILALHRIGRFDMPQVFAIYISSEEPGLHSILFRLSIVNDIATLVPLMRIDITSIISNCPGLTVSQLLPESTKILLYLREEHICIQLSSSTIIYANLRLSHRVDAGGVYRFVLPSTASCMLQIPNTEHITSMDVNEYLYVCVGNTLLRTKAPINFHILSKRQTPMTFKRVAILSTPGEYVCINRSIFSDSTLSEIQSHRPGYKHAATLLKTPIDVAPASKKHSHQPQHAHYPPLPSTLSGYKGQKEAATTAYSSIDSTTIIKHYIMNLSGSSQTPVLLIGTLVHDTTGCFSFFSINIYTLSQVPMSDWKRYTKSEMASASMFRLCKTVGRINLDELCTYRFPLATEQEMEPQQLGSPSLCHIETHLDNFTLCPLRAINNSFFFSMSFIARYTDTDSFRFFYAFQVNCESASIRLVTKQIYLSVPRAPDCNEFSLTEQTIVNNTVAGVHLVSFISDKSENLLFIHDNTRVYFLMMFNERLKFVSGRNLVLVIYSHANDERDVFNIYNLTLSDNCTTLSTDGLEFQEHGGIFEAVSYKYISKYSVGLAATFLRLVGFGKNLMMIQGVAGAYAPYSNEVNKSDGELIKITVFSEKDGNYSSSSKYLILPHTRDPSETSLKHALFASFERYGQVYIVFCIEHAADNTVQMAGDTLKIDSLARIASTTSMTRTSSITTVESDRSMESLLTVASDFSEPSMKTPPGLKSVDTISGFPCPSTDTHADQHARHAFITRDFNLLTVVFTMSGRYLYSTGFQDPDQDSSSSIDTDTSCLSDSTQLRFFSSGVTQFRCLLRRSNLIPHRLFYVLPNDCLRLSFITPYDPRVPLQRHKIHVERFFLPFLSIATCFLSSAPNILRTYTAHMHTTLFRRFITNVLTSSHYLFNITLKDKLQPGIIMKYASFNLYDVSVSISEFTSILLLSASQQYDYDSHLTNYIMTKLMLSKDLPKDRLLPYLVTGVLCLTKQLGPKSSENTSHDLGYDLPSWLESYLSAEHVNVDYTSLAAQSGPMPRVVLPEAHVFRTGLLRILPSVYLRGLFVAIGDTEYRLSKTPNSVVTFYYVLTSRLVVLANLYLRAQNTKVATFLKSHTYTGDGSERAFEIARKNAFVLLAKCDYYMAAAWFILAADFENMLTVLVDKRYMANIDLGLTVFRYMRDVVSNSSTKLTQMSPTFNITPDDLDSMERVLFDATIKKYVVTDNTENDDDLSLRKKTIINLDKAEIAKMSYRMSSSNIHKSITDFINHCTAAYDLMYYYFVLSQYEDNSEFLAAVITDIVATIISFTQHTTLEGGATEDMHEAISVVLHVLHNFIFLCFQCKMTSEIRSILNALYRLYSCNIFGPVEKLRILNLSMYILALSRRTFASAEGSASFFLPADVTASQKQLFNAFELSFVSLIHLHSNTLSTSLLYNAFLYSLNPSRYLGGNHESRMEELKKQCDAAAKDELEANKKDGSLDNQYEQIQHIVSTFVFYLCLGFFTGDGKRATNLMWTKYQTEMADNVLFAHLERRPSRFDIGNVKPSDDKLIRRRHFRHASRTNDYTDNDNDIDDASGNSSSYSYSDDEQSCHESTKIDYSEELIMVERSQPKVSAQSLQSKKRRCRLQTQEEIKYLCRIVYTYFRNIFSFTQSPRIVNHTTQILNSFEASILPVVNTTITKVTSKEVHDVTNSLLSLISTLSTRDEASKQFLDSMQFGARVLQSESEYQPMIASDRDGPSVIQQLLFKRRDNPTSASSDRELLKQPKHREKGVITISDMEMHTTMLSDAMGGPYDDDCDRLAQTPFAKHPVLRRSLAFVIVMKNTSLMIERYDTLLEFYSYLTLTPGGYTRYVPAAFNSALAATAHSISTKRKEASTTGFEMLSVFLGHGSNSLSHIVRHGLTTTKRNELTKLDSFLATHAQNPIADVRIANLFYILIALHEYTINNGSMLLFRNTMQNKYGIQIQLKQLMEKTSNCPYKDILPAYHSIFKEIQRNALTADEISYLEMLESAGPVFVEKLLIAKKLILLEIYYIISRYKMVPTKESRVHHIRGSHDSNGATLIPSTLITFLKNPFVCFLNGLLNHVFYSPRLALSSTSVDLLHKTQVPSNLADELLPALKNTLFWQTYIAKDWKTGPASSDKFFDGRLLRYCILLSKYILLYLYPSSILVFSIMQNENPPYTATSDGTMMSADVFDDYNVTDESSSEDSTGGSSDTPLKSARKTRLKSKVRKDQPVRHIYELKLMLEYTNVTSFIQTSENTFYILVKSSYIISVTLHTECEEIATVSAPISTNFNSEKLIGGLDTINDLGVLFSKSMYSVFCKDGIVVPAVQNRNIKFGLTDASLSLKTAIIHDMALLTNFQALALVSYVERGSSDNTPPKLILATVNLLNCSIIDGIELEEEYTHIVMTKVRDVQILLLFGAQEYCILCKHVAGATDTYIKAEGGSLPEDVGSALVLAEALCEGSRVIYRLVHAAGRGTVRTHVITYHVNVV